MRYRMLETIHEYATERAAETPELRATAERRHTRLLPRPRRGGRPAPALRRPAPLDRPPGDGARQPPRRPPPSLVAADDRVRGAIALAIGWFWWLRNYRREGATWAARPAPGQALTSSRRPAPERLSLRPLRRAGDPAGPRGTYSGRAARSRLGRSHGGRPGGPRTRGDTAVPPPWSCASCTSSSWPSPARGARRRRADRWSTSDGCGTPSRGPVRTRHASPASSGRSPCTSWTTRKTSGPPSTRPQSPTAGCTAASGRSASP